MNCLTDGKIWFETFQKAGQIFEIWDSCVNVNRIIKATTFNIVEAVYFIKFNLHSYDMYIRNTESW